MATACINQTNSFKNVYIETIIETVLNTDLDQWEHFAKGGKKLEIPFNATSGNHYNGLNLLKLMFNTFFKGYTSPYYLTKDQAFKLGADIKGEKTTKIYYFGNRYVNKETGEKISEAKYKAIKKPIEIKEKLYKKEAFNTPYFVVNFDQIKNLDQLDLSSLKLEIPKFEIDFDLNDKAEDFFLKLQEDETKKMVLNRKRIKKAFYSPSIDEITIPITGIFKNNSSYYSTTFHEMIHWTGHEKRLNRLGFDVKGDDNYAYEELIAELGALLLCNDYKIFDTFYNSCSYLKSWLSNTNETERENNLRNAFLDALKAKKYLTKF